MSELKRKAHAAFPDLVGRKARLTGIMISFLVGQKAEMSGSVESGEFKITSLIRGATFTKQIDYIAEGTTCSGISDVKIIVDGVNGRPLDLSCVEVLTIIEEAISDDEKIVSYTYNVETNERGVIFHRVDDFPDTEIELSEDCL